jgi:hypothetical protein
MTIAVLLTVLAVIIIRRPLTRRLTQWSDSGLATAFAAAGVRYQRTEFAGERGALVSGRTSSCGSRA